MIGKIVIGKSFYHAISYCLEDKKELTLEQKLEMSKRDGCQHLGRAEVLYYNLCSGNKQELVHDFSEVAHLSNQVEKPVLHLSLKLSPGEHLERNKWIEAAQDFAADFKLENNQYIAVLHKDSKEEHIHILANRVGFNGKAVSDSNSYKKVSELCCKLELKHELKQVLNPHLFLTQEQRHEYKLDQRIDSRKERMKEFIRDNLLEAKDFNDFRLRMERDGFKLHKGRGIAFTDEKKVTFKGSQLGYSLSNIEKILEQKLELRVQLKQRIDQERKPEQKQTAGSEMLMKEKRQNLLPDKEMSPGRKQEIPLLKDLRLERLITELMKPEREQSLAYEFTAAAERRRRRKRPHHHI
jgi:Relaxase/Mobilisation nuclease domain